MHAQLNPQSVSAAMTALTPGYGQSPAQAFAAAQWALSMDAIAQPVVQQPAVYAYRDAAGNIAGHMAVMQTI